VECDYCYKAHVCTTEYIVAWAPGQASQEETKKLIKERNKAEKKGQTREGQKTERYRKMGTKKDGKEWWKDKDKKGMKNERMQMRK
jgi:hypothetical protein